MGCGSISRLVDQRGNWNVLDCHLPSNKGMWIITLLRLKKMFIFNVNYNAEFTLLWVQLLGTTVQSNGLYFQVRGSWDCIPWGLLLRDTIEMFCIDRACGFSTRSGKLTPFQVFSSFIPLHTLFPCTLWATVITFKIDFLSLSRQITSDFPHCHMPPIIKGPK